MLGSIPSARLPHGPRTQRCLHTPPAATVAQGRPSGRVLCVTVVCPFPAPSPNGRLPAPLGGTRGRPPLRSEINQRGSSRVRRARGGHDGLGSRLRPRESVGVLAFAKFPRTGRRSRPQASAWGSREPPVFQRALRAPWPPAGGSQDSGVRRKFSPRFSPGPGLFVGLVVVRARLKDLGCLPLVWFRTSFRGRWCRFLPPFFPASRTGSHLLNWCARCP
jgi:hypothetical protein